MVNIDTVYQRVLALANKEQRGYITPQEFNLFANQAQIEIFEQYFYDLNKNAKVQGNEYIYADIDDMLEEKLQVFERNDPAATIATYATSNLNGLVGRVLPNYIYRVSRVGLGGIECEILKTKDFQSVVNGTPLIRPTNQRPVANIRNNILVVVGNATTTATNLIYFRRPERAQWGYVVVNNQAMFDPNPNKTTHFELHSSEESELVYKILKQAGISIKDVNLAQQAQGLESLKVQQEKQ